MENLPSPLDTLRQLKEMLDAGALTPTEFDSLKQRLVFSDASAVPPAPTLSEPVAPVPPVAPPLPPPPVPTLPLSEPVAPEPQAESRPVWARTNDPVIPPPGAPTPVAFYPEPLPEPLPESELVSSWTADEFPESEAPPARSPLALILSIGGLLALLGLVLYLSMNKRSSEHISSTSQTAADSLAAPIETGPQAEQLPASVAVPETIRVAPAHPAPIVQRRSAPVRDSAVVATPATVPAAPDTTVGP